jgi:hypothetical protein
MRLAPPLVKMNRNRDRDIRMQPCTAVEPDLNESKKSNSYLCALYIIITPR